MAELRDTSPGKWTFAALAMTAILMTAGSAHATVAYDTSLASPPGTYFGSGNPNTHWTVDTEGGVEIGLQTLIRYTTGPITPLPSSSTYLVPTGVNIPHGGSLWDFAFSLNVSGAGLTLADVTTTLTMVDTANATSGSFDPLNSGVINDNDLYGPGGKNASTNLSQNYGVQNAETPSFGNIGLGLNDTGFNPYQNDVYHLTFSVSCNNATKCGSVGMQLASVSETIATPEPASLALLATGCLGLLGLRRRLHA